MNKPAYHAFAFIMAFMIALSLSGCGVTGQGAKPAASEGDTFLSVAYTSNEISLTEHMDVLQYMTKVGDKIVIAGSKDSSPILYILNTDDGDGRTVSPDTQGAICGIASDDDAFWVLFNGENGHTLAKYDVTGALQKQVSPQYLETQYQMCPAVTENGLLLLWDSSEIRLYDQTGVLCEIFDQGTGQIMTVGADAEGVVVHARLGNQTRLFLLGDQALEQQDLLFPDAPASGFTAAVGTQSAYPLNAGYSLFLYDRAADTYTKAFNWNTLSINRAT